MAHRAADEGVPVGRAELLQPEAGVHGVGGTIGALLTGVFASSLINPIFKDSQGRVLPSGLLEGNVHQLMNQAVGVFIAVAISAVGTYAILLVTDLVLGVRVSHEEEVRGLDLTQHGEEGYSWEPSLS